MANLARTEKLGRITQRYLRLRDEISGERVSNNFRSIMNNLLSPMQNGNCNEKINYDDRAWETAKIRYRRQLRLVNSYLKLLKDFPEFGEEELKEMPLEERVREEKTKLNPEEFVTQSYELLRGISYTHPC